MSEHLHESLIPLSLRGLHRPGCGALLETDLFGSMHLTHLCFLVLRATEEGEE